MPKLVPSVLEFTPGTTTVLGRYPRASHHFRNRRSAPIAALLAASIPSSVLVLVLTVLLGSLPDNWITKAAIQSAVASAVAITAKTGWTIAEPYFRDSAR